MIKGIKGKTRITAWLKSGLAVLLALTMILSVGVTDARAGNSYGYGVDNPASLEWSEDEYDELVNTAGFRKDVYVNPQTTGNVVITSIDPSASKVKARKDI